MSSLNLIGIERPEYLIKHGHHSSTNTTIGRILAPSHELKGRFLQTLQEYPRVSIDDDRLIDIVTSHGVPSGGISVGSLFDNFTPKRLGLQRFSTSRVLKISREK